MTEQPKPLWQVCEDSCIDNPESPGTPDLLLRDWALVFRAIGNELLRRGHTPAGLWLLAEANRIEAGEVE